MQGPCAENQVAVARHQSLIESVNWVLHGVVTSLTHRDAVDFHSYGTWDVIPLSNSSDWLGNKAKESDIRDDVRQLLNLNSNSLDRQDIIVKVQEWVLLLLNSMLEGDVDSAVAANLVSDLDFDLLSSVLKEALSCAKRYKKDKKAMVGLSLVSTPDEDDDLLMSDEADVEAMEAALSSGRGNKSNKPKVEKWSERYSRLCAEYYLFVRTLIARHRSSKCKEKYSSQFISFLQSAEFQECEDKYGSMIASVEIVRNGKLEVCLFRVPKMVRKQSKTPGFKITKKTVVYSVRRDNQVAKLDDFLRSCKKIAISYLFVVELTNTCV